MPDTPTILYWDSCAFLSYVNEYPDRISTLDALLESSASGAIELYTSTISHVEVAFGATEQLRRRLDPKVEQQISSLWSDPNVVVSVEYHDGIGQSARDLIREAVTRGWSLKPLDAIHLATAQWLSSVGIEIDEYNSYDTRLFKYAPLVAFSVCEPHTLQPNMI